MGVNDRNTALVRNVLTFLGENQMNRRRKIWAYREEFIISLERRCSIKGGTMGEIQGLLTILQPGIRHSKMVPWSA